MDNDQSNFASRHAFSCEEVEDLLDRFLDRELSEDEHKRFEAHLGHCDFCRCLAEDCDTLVRTARTLADLPIPAEVSNRLRQRLGQELQCTFSNAKPRLYLVK